MRLAMVTFDTIVEVSGKAATYFRVPLDVPALFGGQQRPPVCVMINGHAYRTTVSRYDGDYVVPLNRTHRLAAGVEAGDLISVEIEPDTESRQVEPPPELAAALETSDEAKALYGALSYTHRKEYAEWVGGAKRPETRTRRAARAVDQIMHS